MEFDPDRICGFDWDSGNRQKSERKHGVTPEEAEQIFTNVPLVIVPDREHSRTETRFHAFGITNQQRFLHVSFTLRGNGSLIRVISARDMSRHERARFEESQENPEIPQ